MTSMHLDVVGLREFYGLPLGKTARRLVGRAVRRCWPNVTGMSVVGLGYATPYLGVFKDEAERVVALMPAQQGVLHWPRDGRYLAGLADETCLPLSDSSVDRLLLVHHLEGADQLRPALREVWRVLAPGGRVLIVAANRRGMWSARETTPFGQGQPFSRGQLVSLLRESMFTPVEWASALFMPPVGWRMFLRSALAWERLGMTAWPRFSGVILVEATKQIYAPTGHRERARRRLPLVSPARVRAPARTSLRTLAHISTSSDLHVEADDAEPRSANSSKRDDPCPA